MKRLAWLDISKGLAILTVVYFHFFRTYFEHGSLSPADWSTFFSAVRSALGIAWVHLRTCLTCGNVACCDSSPERHAHTHYEDTGHPVMRSAEPGESWRWCFLDRLTG